MSEVTGFAVKAKGAIDFLKSKLPERSLAWDDLAGPVNAKVFTVAGATSLSVVTDLHKAITDAADNGTTITEFRKAFDKTVAQSGWSYNGSRGWRTRIIFDANLRSAHMAGRWSQIWAGRDRRPFLQYRTAGDARVRPQHRQWNGIVRAITDAFWSVFYPPNGWGCRCTVRALTQSEIDAKGLTVDTAPFPVQTRTVTKAGEPTDVVPVGVDPGWDHNVGVSWIAPEVALGRKLASLPADLRDRFIAKTISPAFQEALSARWKAFRGALKDVSQAPGAAQIVGFLDGKTIDALQTQVPDAQIRSTAVAVPATTAADAAAMAWPTDLLDQLPVQLRNYQTVLWDTEAGGLVIVPEDTGRSLKRGRVGMVAVRPATAGPAKGALEVTSVDQARPADLTAPRFTVLLGRLPK
jgi:SPP1 gp7 family putative phage head morphogenesis protein